MFMKENYFKSFFKSFGYITIIVVLLAFVLMGYVGYINTHIIGESAAVLIKYGILVLVPGLAIVGLTKLKSEKLGFIDFLRVSGFLGAIIVAIFAAVGKASLLNIIIPVASALVFLIEVIFRVKFADDNGEEVGIRNYLGSLAGTFNGLIILIVGVAFAVLGTFLLKNAKVEDFINGSNFKFILIAVSACLIFAALIPALDKNAEVTIFDLILAGLFVGATYLSIISVALVSKKLFVTLILVVVLLLITLLIRGLSYNKGKGYENPANKVRTYFKQAYEKYDAAIAIILGGVAVLFFALTYACAHGSNVIANKFGNSLTVFAVIAIVLAVLMIVLLFVFRKVKSTKIEKVDWLLIAMFFASGAIIPLAIASAINGNFGVITGNTMLLVAFIVYGVVFLIALIVQFMRLRNYDPLFAIARDSQKKAEEEAAQEEAAEEETAEEEEVVEEEQEENDPFALTEEDEAIYKEVYGEEETEEEEQPEEAVEEVVYEEAPEEEEVVYEEAPAEEVPAEEEVVEEVVEEAAPAEEEVVEEEETEEEEAEEEDEAEDEADEFEEAEGEEVVDEIQHTKEAGILVQDFQVVDEEGKPKKIKRKFISKMMFAPYETKEYYNEIKNYLQLYRAKGRNSARCESYRYKGLVAKVALGGKSIKVFLAIDPSFIDENPKYHLKNVSDKKQYAEVPVMIKVRSQRALKYFKELVDYMMANRLVKPKRNYTPVNYMPQLIPNGEAIMATLGMSTDYLHNTMNVHSIPDDMPDDLVDYIPMIPGDELEEGEEIEANVYLDTLCNHFEDGDEITIDVLKTLHIVTKGNVLRIKARGTLDRKLIIYAEYFDPDALKMLMCTNCTAIRIVRNYE